MSGGHDEVAAESSTTTRTATEKKDGGGVVMRTHVAVVCSAVGFLGFVILILGVAGEAATAQAYVRGPGDFSTSDDDYGTGDYDGDTKCEYRTTPAVACGFVAALLAITAQSVVTATSLFCGCCRTWEAPKEPRRVAGVVLSAVSWITVILVAALFIAGAALNVDQETQPNADGRCYVDPGSSLFAAATVLSVAATGMQIASYILLQVAATTRTISSTKHPLETQQPELGMGQPVVEPEPPKQNGEEVVAVGGQGHQVLPPPASAAVPSQATEPASQV